MGFYAERILPRLIHLAMRRHDLTPYRTRIASAATGNVLEIGIGSEGVCNHDADELRQRPPVDRPAVLR
jgi:hypothetical protein